MSDLVPDDLWLGRILPSLLVHEAVCVRAACRAKAALVTAALLVERIDGSLGRHSLTGLIDIDRTAPLPFTYVLRAAYVLEQGSNEWPGMGRFIRLAAIYRLTPANGLPLLLSAQWLAAHLPSRTAFHQLPLAMAIYRLFGHMLTHNGLPLCLSADALPRATASHRMPLAMAICRLFRHLLTYGFNSRALQQADNGSYRIGNSGPFRVVPLGELPGGHRYAESYKRTDPVIRWSAWLYPSFSAFLLHKLLRWWSNGEGVRHRMVLRAVIGRGDPRYGRLLTDAITEDQGIDAYGGNLNAADPIDFRNVIVSGHRPGETVAAYLYVWSDIIHLYTTEAHVADRSQPVADRYPESAGAARRLLRPFGLESAVIDRGRVVG
ncbi:unnamed protein product [Vitrella brassicaformis CCMP3155]|uniref:Uncharacterized protein n=1 Tax=Vitrella brassicaformis (strain CCMP3155) TaxID=1169540 RepID=A0A0G4EZX2_VITBC|nr:unnamed protein product [Vitrella brassicaformis CCMP3155]|eukprot:CEM04384.1 unnamed protein product [Vitrella brassicaformis CCMP3155]